jgi:hypothetical protein
MKEQTEGEEERLVRRLTQEREKKKKRGIRSLRLKSLIVCESSFNFAAAVSERGFMSYSCISSCGVEGGEVSFKTELKAVKEPIGVAEKQGVEADAEESAVEESAL